MNTKQLEAEISALEKKIEAFQTRFNDYIATSNAKKAINQYISEHKPKNL